MKKLIVSGLILAAAGAMLFGWLPRDRSWQAATGWNDLDDARQPPGGLSQVLFRHAPDAATIQWLGHSGFLIEWADQSILLDPNFQTRVALSRRFIDPPQWPESKSIDLVCISHAHYDHLSPDTLNRMAPIEKIIVPKKSEGYLKGNMSGQTVIQGLDRWESTKVGKLTITAVPAKHNGCRHHPWRSKYMAVGYVLSDGRNSLYFAGDTAYQPDEFDQIKARLHPDTALLPIGCYAPRIPFKIHHIDPREAALTGKRLGVTQVIPCHFGTYRQTLDGPTWALPRFAEEASQQDLYWSMPQYYE